MATSFVFGLPGVPYLTLKQHFRKGETVEFEGLEYLVEKADPVTRKDQGQNVYLVNKSVINNPKVK